MPHLNPGRRIAALAMLAACTAWLTLIAPAQAQRYGDDRRQNTPGQFDFYVLALSWSPSYCEAAGERAQGRNDARDGQQCGARPYSFVVHGLWPQYERGFPESCQVPAPRLNRKIVSSMLDLMPSTRLIFHQWRKHGTCSGLSANGYFQTVRRARAVVKIPDRFIDLDQYLTVTPDEVETAFVAANPALPRAAISVTCDTRRLHEVRICMSKEFGFRSCAENERRACRRQRLAMPPVRGG
jgi:ribonuclease T2